MSWKAGFWMAVGFLLMLPLFYLDYGDTEYPDLKKAERVVRYVSAERQVKRSSFLSFAGEKTPSRFVEWMFSVIGTAEWYMVDQPGGEFDSEELNAIKKSGVPLLPPDVAVVPVKPDPGRGKQVVVKPDDARQMLIVESYIDPKSKPVRASEWKFLQ